MIEVLLDVWSGESIVEMVIIGVRSDIFDMLTVVVRDVLIAAVTDTLAIVVSDTLSGVVTWIGESDVQTVIGIVTIALEFAVPAPPEESIFFR